MPNLKRNKLVNTSLRQTTVHFLDSSIGQSVIFSRKVLYLAICVYAFPQYQRKLLLVATVLELAIKVEKFSFSVPFPPAKIQIEQPLWRSKIIMRPTSLETITSCQSQTWHPLHQSKNYHQKLLKVAPYLINPSNQLLLVIQPKHINKPLSFLMYYIYFS